MRDIFHLSTLIIKKKLKILKEDEKKLLRSIRAENSLEKKTDFARIARKISHYSLINKDLAWNSIMERTSGRTAFSFKKERRFLRYGLATAAAIAILFGISYFAITDSTPEKQPEAVVSGPIKIGGSRAVLTLEDGTSIGLEKGALYNNPNAASNGESIVYDASAKASPLAANVLTIPRGGQFSVQLSDGTKVWLNSESQLRFPIAFKEGQTRQVELVYGEAYFEVSQSRMHKGARFRVRSNGQDIEVLGTEFNVKAYQDEQYIYTTLVHGSVQLTKGNSKKLLRPGEQSVIEKDGADFNIRNADVFSEVSWKEGVFSFKEMPLRDIMKVLSRWYDVSVRFNTPKNELVRINGILDKDQKIEDILKIISRTNKIPYEINQKTIIFQ